MERQPGVLPVPATPGMIARAAARRRRRGRQQVHSALADAQPAEGSDPVGQRACGEVEQGPRPTGPTSRDASTAFGSPTRRCNILQHATKREERRSLPLTWRGPPRRLSEDPLEIADVASRVESVLERVEGVDYGSTKDCHHR